MNLHITFIFPPFSRKIKLVFPTVLTFFFFANAPLGYFATPRNTKDDCCEEVQQEKHFLGQLLPAHEITEHKDKVLLKHVFFFMWAIVWCSDI